MVLDYSVPLIVVVGILVLFFFPEPETNFIAYVGTALFFTLLTVFLIFWQKRKK
ncbi:hypothetical protein HN587_02130 [Candidatus Woesearchaeota archaeon]|jgi:hypothetical protein|nr:hypothetical protein [Candidatus Woesearchaeota archaeon]